ncbi:MAG: 4-hydroxybenzoate octaprenyltransferase [Granulosicoccus sp.]
MNTATFKKKLPHLIALLRLDRPIGIYLLMWPMLWALWFAAGGLPKLDVLIIFLLGTVLTRSAGCAINDYADRDFDGRVTRTRMRPLATGALTSRDALSAAAVLMIAAFLLILLTNQLTIMLSFIALLLASIYPFTKRLTHLPQLVLGAAFGFAIPMAYAAQTGRVDSIAWLLFLAAVLWAVAYDTLYAMADREDDLKIGVRSTAILFGRADLLMVGIIQASVLILLAIVGDHESRGIYWNASLVAAAGFAVYQLWLARHRTPARCIQAFLNNNWLGLVLFIGLVIDYAAIP